MAKLTYKQKKFTEEYIKNKGNASKAVTKVYDVKNDRNAANLGHAMMKNIKIKNEIEARMEAQGFSIDGALTELLKLIKQDEDKGNKNRALKQYFDMTKRQSDNLNDWLNNLK